MKFKNQNQFRCFEKELKYQFNNFSPRRYLITQPFPQIIPIWPHSSAHIVLRLLLINFYLNYKKKFHKSNSKLNEKFNQDMQKEKEKKDIIIFILRFLHKDSSFILKGVFITIFLFFYYCLLVTIIISEGNKEFFFMQ